MEAPESGAETRAENGITLERVAELLTALAEPTRLRILALLKDGEVCVCHIHESLKIPQPKASRHLAYLRRSRLVFTRREGLWVHYRLAEDLQAPLRQVLDAVLASLTSVSEIARDGVRLEARTGRSRVARLTARVQRPGMGLT
ncbi:MAG: metalloregulator ArsR/SmtB family transcription factor [Luteitalea sp.]|nr:metalloregulator ArsR/SmtB family transcription factor [Luteitalea sp.]